MFKFFTGFGFFYSSTMGILFAISHDFFWGGFFILLAAGWFWMLTWPKSEESSK